MYSFQASAGKRKNKQHIRLLRVIIFILIIALIAVSFVYLQSRGLSDTVSESLIARATSEAGSAQSAVYRLTQSSGTNTMTLLSTVRGHVYALQCLNSLAANIYGPGTALVDGEIVTACLSLITECETRLQAGSVLTDQMTQLRDNIDLLVSGFSALQ